MAKKLTHKAPPKMEAAFNLFPRIVAEKKKRHLERQKFLKKYFAPFSRELLKRVRADEKKRMEREARPPTPKVHQWRLCPGGQHWVRSHSRSPGVTVTGYCRLNRTGKDQLYPDEMLEIQSQHFQAVKRLPKARVLEFPNADQFDTIIAGWTQYWNEVLRPDVPLEPNLVKALIASESGFKPISFTRKKDAARGLMQLLDSTRKILSDEKGELRDHLLNLSKEDALDPNINVAAGIRWLFHKRVLASKRMKRSITWEEAVFEYKSILRDPDKRDLELRNRFLAYLKALQ